MYYNGAWLAILAQMMTKEDAHVFCRQLGYPKAIDVRPLNVDENAETIIGFSKFFCSGNESKCSECRRFVTLGMDQVDIKYQFHQEAAMLHCEKTEKIQNESKYQYAFVYVSI